MDRRSFLKKTTVIAASSQFFIAKDLFAKGSPNEIVNVGFIGLGKQFHGNLNNAISDPRCIVRSICDVDDARLSLVQKKIESAYGDLGKKNKVCAYKDFRKMLADPSLDAVFIVTPDHWHAIMSVSAAKAGKHIYCEKPLSFTVDESTKIVNAVKNAGVVFQTGSMQRSHWTFRNAVQLARAGMLGEIKSIWCDVPWRFPTVYNWKAEEIPSGIDWNMWVGPAPMRPYSDHLLPKLREKNPYSYPWAEWRWHSDYGNGMQADWGAHMFDIAQWALNMDCKGPKFIDVYPAQNPNFPNDKKCISYEYENGVKVYYGAPTSLFYKHGFRGFNLWGKKNVNPMITIVGSDGIAAASRESNFWTNKPSLANAKIESGSASVMVSNDHYDNFIRAIKSGSPTICPAEVGASSCNMCLIGNIAYKLGKRLEWNWKELHFADNADADKLLWREYRGEWKNTPMV